MMKKLRDRYGLNWFVLLVLALAAVVSILYLIPVNYYVLRPGQALSVSPMISAKGLPAVKSKGALYMTDVYLESIHHKLQELYWRLDSSAEIQPATSISGGLPDKQFTELNLDMMRNSEQAAEAAALEVARGYRPTFATNGPEIQLVMSGTPAASVLHSGDIIKSAGGIRISKPTELQAVVRRIKPGATIPMVIVRHQKTLHVNVRTIAAENGVPNKQGKTALIGIYVAQRLLLPITVRINSGDIGGPSAGLMFSLGLVERLQQRDITKGCKIAGTGTIDFQGNVGPIGGAKQKIIAARDAGATYFLVPQDKDNVKGAMAGRGSVIVKPVKTLRQALEFLRTIKACR